MTRASGDRPRCKKCDILTSGPVEDVFIIDIHGYCGYCIAETVAAVAGLPYRVYSPAIQRNLGWLINNTLALGLTDWREMVSDIPVYGIAKDDGKLHLILDGGVYEEIDIVTMMAFILNAIAAGVADPQESPFYANAKFTGGKWEYLFKEPLAAIREGPDETGDEVHVLDV